MILPERCDVAIIGAGPAGSALAALLARAGRAPVLLERDVFPRPKLCGEFLSMEARGLLERVGCWEAVAALRPRAIERARFFSPSGRELEFGLGAPAWSLSRYSLDEALWRHARASGAAAFDGARVVRVTPDADGVLLDVELRGSDGSLRARRLRAERVVAAYGRRSGLEEPSASPGRSPFVGFKRRHVSRDGRAAARLAGVVEVHLFDGGYCGVSAVEDGSVNVCLLAHERVMRGAAAGPRDTPAFLSGLSPSLRGCFADLRPDGEPLAAAQLTFAAKASSAGPVLFLGDAAGMIAPLCGDGQAMALESALLLAELMAREDGAHLPRLWDDAWRRRFSTRLRLGAWLQGLLLRPRAAEAAVSLLRPWPALAGSLLALTRTPCDGGA